MQRTNATAAGCLAILLAASVPSWSVTTISTPSITTHTTWGPTGNPPDTEYLVTVDVTVQSNAILTVQPGTTIRFASGRYLRMGGGTPGSLVADGTPSEPIVFSGENATPGYWDGLWFPDNSDSPGAGSVLDHCRIEYGGSGQSALVYCQSTTTPVMTACELRASSVDALVLENSSIPISGCTFDGSVRYPVRLLAPLDVAAVVASNTFVPNGSGKFNAFVVRAGVIAASTTWPVPPAGFTYLIENGNDIEVQGAGSPVLTLQPGTVIKQQGSTFWRIGQSGQGALNATGVTFTSAFDDTVGDATGNGATTPAPGDWESIVFYDLTIDASAALTSCTIRYGGNYQPFTGAVGIISARPTIANCLFENNRFSSLGVGNQDATLSVTGCTFRAHDIAAVYLHPGAVEPVLKPAAGNAFIPNASGKFNVVKVQTTLGGAITTSTTWPVPPPGFTYLVENGHDIELQGAGAPVLTLQPGTVVKQQGSTFWRVGQFAQGALNATGVTFTSAFDDTVGDATGNGATTPAPGDWESIVFLNLTIDGSSALIDCQVRYGGNYQPFLGAVGVSSASPTIANCVFERNRFSSLGVDGQIPTLSVTGCMFRVHDIAAVDLHPSAVEAVLKPAAGNTFIPNASGKFNVIQVLAGTIITSTTWPVPPTGFTYLVANGGDIEVQSPSSPVLTLQSGTVIKQQGATFWRIGASTLGALRATGTIFTSAFDDIIGDATGNGATSPAPGDWESIVFMTNAVAGSCILDQCEFKYGGGAFQGMVSVRDIQASFLNCLFQSSSTAGLILDRSNIAPVIVDRCVFASNQYGIRSINNGRVRWRVELSCFEGNAVAGIQVTPYTDGLGPMSATGCWWGDPSGPSGVGPGTGDAVSAQVLFDPWRTYPACDIPVPIEDHPLPTRFDAPLAYPNPFNPSVTIPFQLPAAAYVTIDVFDVDGGLVRRLVTRSFPAGVHDVSWDGTDDDGTPAASGLYFYRLRAGSEVVTRKIVLLK